MDEKKICLTENSLFDKENKLIAPLKPNIDWNIEILKEIFAGSNDIVQKTFFIHRKNKKVKIHLIYIDGLSNNEMTEETLLKPLLFEWREETHDEMDLWDELFYKQVQTVDVVEKTCFDDVLLSVLKGDTALFVDGYDKAMVISTKKFPLRGISDNDKEAGLRGPRDSFNEGFRQSTALIRRRIRDSKLVCEQGTIGQRSRTDYAIMYLRDVAREEMIEDIRQRFRRYDIDAIFDSGMGEHLLEGDWQSPFPMFQSTTRPDKVAAGIVEGRVAIVFDNSPEVLLAPANLNMLLQASDDYYSRWTVGTFARFLRYVACIIAVCLPGLYIAITVYHSEMLPTGLLYAISAARSRVTFPIVVEVLIMEFFFELLREAGIRLPGTLGNTIGVVGGLIVGQAAVDAGIVSTIVVIVVALTAIASFSIPNEVFASVFRLLKFFIIITSSFFGLYGFILGLLILVIHISSLESFGVPYMLPVVGQNKRGNHEKDFILRSPIDKMIMRPMWAKSKNKIRLKRK